MRKQNIEPQDLVLLYYKLLYSGDLTGLGKIMARSSYFITLESFGLSLSIKDTAFKGLLENIENDASSLAQVEYMLSKDLISRHLSPKIEIISIQDNGIDRKTINYLEDGAKKQLHFSKENVDWKINYFAGRKTE
ncbi:MAG: hypothetical protein ACWGHH_05770 [Sulfurovaceae bacterium]